MEVVEDLSRESPKSEKEVSPAAEPQEFNKRNKKEDRSSREDRNIELFMKSLNSNSNLHNVDEKLAYVAKKYVQSVDENRKLQFYIKQSDKRHNMMVKEKELIQFENNKTILAKSKLENLCRELQKHNKAVKEESLLKIREEEEKRKETQAKFHSTLSEITAMLQQNNEKNAKLRDDNISMTEKFKSIMQQYQLREQQVQKMSKQMTLEAQLSDAKLQKAALEHQAEKEFLLKEAEQMKITIAQYKVKIMELQGNESALRSQLAIYTDKYDEFQNALVKSNQVFGGFKEEMEKMAKKIQKLEKESLSWKNRWEMSQKALLEMCGEMQNREEKVAIANKHLAQMQSLCRTLQAERTVLLNTLKVHSIERPPVPAPLPATLPPMPSASDAKVDAMEANCVQLKQKLAELQTQFNTLTNKGEEKEESPKVEIKKKSKSKKKNKAQEKPAAVSETGAGEIKDSEEKSRNSSPEDAHSEIGNLMEAVNIANINLCELEVVQETTTNENVVPDLATSISTVTSEITDPNQLQLEAVDDKLNTTDTTVVNGDVLSQGNRIVNDIINEKNDIVDDVQNHKNDIVNNISNDVNDEKHDEKTPAALDSVVNKDETVDTKTNEAS
ncbi:unnamed protein product [Leptidea sinapis]|uniref:Alpha-taxilin n=1 Tax=Leptidea sinapis TaxID=189913 RepID=A0A5E4QPL9_9NEOP|nr:unnamed protein product [Leptidea sinapis]